MMSSSVSFNVKVATVCGIREAVIATLFWNLLESGEGEIIFRYGRNWVRISQKMITTIFTFMTIDMVQGSLQKLIERGIIKRGDFNKDKFDHTNWYSFSEYGCNLMKS